MNKKQTIIVISMMSLLLIPLIAMQFSAEVNWSLFDFLIAGVLLIGTGLLIEYVSRSVSGLRRRKVIIAGIVLLFVLVWAEMAVGIFGSPVAGN
ncbi:hypothetical protein [Lutimonas zeaxanthinifaciens]|uniref:hypothetical protein n=1 Tax=Lutimonas zeaxanthinifaciens TaxID=3060215 RepID=UPI00265D35EE|nr:hypothetical protein [Lutimonas sp. YSD2104]WKK67170.1 hypothetical protein QZH61_05985 [Lutimonas sp. YSD2104]